MAEAKDKQGAGGPGGPRAGAAGAPEAGARPSLRAIWPVALLVLALVLFVTGLVAAVLTRPKADPSRPLDEAKALVEHGRHEEAIDLLNGKVLAFIDSGMALPGQVREFALTRARAFSGAQAALGISRAENHQVVIKDLLWAEELGKPGGEALAPEDVSRLVEAYLATDQIEKALDRIRSLPEAESARRTRLTRQLIERNLAATDRREELTLDLLASLSLAPELSSADRVWVLARQAELLLFQRQPEEAINKILQRMQRLRDVPGDSMAELYVLLGRAYFATDQPEIAAKHLEAADTRLDRTSPLRADVNLLLGLLAQAEFGKNPDNAEALAAARERFETVLHDFSSSRAFLPAVQGLAEVLAAGSEDEPAIERYAELVDAIRRSKTRPEVTREQASESLMTWHRDRYERGDKRTGLRYAQLADSLFADGETPASLLLALARTHRDIADETLQAAREERGADFSVADLDPATRAEVKQHYLAAGDGYRRHATRVSAADTDAYAVSLWTAADSFDRAGDLDEARRSFELYLDGAADADPNKPAARFRLAQIFQAQQGYGAAEALYEDLLKGRGELEPGRATGAWADRSIVPLARCLLSDPDAANDARAESLLLSVVDGSVMSPDASDYREALVQLGGFYYGAGRYPDAIARLEQAVERYPDSAQIESLRFKLADSHRLAAGRVRQDLRGALRHDEREELEARHAEHLRTAMALYDLVRVSLEERDQRRATALEKTYLRNAYFYAGDCAFELGDFDRAIAAYDTARLKYADDPSSLVAMVQIVSAYVAQGKLGQARTANERARQQLTRFPEEVWSRPDLPMEKKHWERWLDARTLLDGSAQAGPGAEEEQR